ncbi:hypothetical protein [Ottowia sp. VDI28]|uniref:hypothetical protein n=1 Tax=Ottowia sp. VDI28 TaxID=3133968 RepID=UPI003C2FC036
MLQGADPSLVTPPPAGKGQPGARAEARPQAQTITPPPAKPETQPAQRPALEERQAQASQSAPKLVRLARYSALPSQSELLVESRSSREATSAKPARLPSVSQAMARLGPPKTNTLLEWLLSFFSSNKPSDPASAVQTKVLGGLEAYHNACNTRDGATAMVRLNELSQEIDRAGDHESGTTEFRKMVADLRERITSERIALQAVLAEMQGGQALPENTTLLHAVDFAREGLSLEKMEHLLNEGLQPDQAKEAREILEDRKLQAAYTRQPVGYKLILGNLQSYHDACDMRGGGTSLLSHAGVAEVALAQLGELSEAIDRYLTHPQNKENKELKQTLQDLRAQISIEHKVLAGVLTELKEGVPLPEDAALSHALAFAREGVSLKDMARLMEKGLLRHQAADARELLDSERASSMMSDFEKRPPEEKARITRDYNEGEILLLQLSGLGRKGGDEFRRLGIPVTRQTVAMERTDEQRLGDMSRLGSGAFNEVYGARYGGPAGIVNGVFKPLSNEEHGWVAAMIGINTSQPQIANRNLATQDMAKALGFDVVVDCQIGTRQHQDPKTGETKLQVGLVMGRAPGADAHHTSVQHFENPEVRREIIKLQLLDHLVGQGDRHGGNYFIDLKQDSEGRTKVKVSGIDNDQCFGENTTHANDIRYVRNDPMRDGYRGTKMPELIDTGMAAAIRSLTPEKLETSLGDKLSPAEVQAAIKRLQSMQAHVDKLERQDQILTPDQWNSMSALEASHYLKASNSYLARDMGYAKKRF